MSFCLFFVSIGPISAKSTKTDSLLRVASQLNYSNDETIKLLLENNDVYNSKLEDSEEITNEISSLIEHSINDTLWCKYYVRMSYLTNYINVQHNDSIFKYSSLANDYCTLCGDTLNMIKMQFSIVDNYLYHNDNEKVFRHINKALKISKLSEDTFLLAGSYLMLGSFYFKIKHYEEAIKAYELSIAKIIGTPNEYRTYIAYGRLAILYYLLGDYEKSLENCQACIAFSSAAENLNKTQPIYAFYEQTALLSLLYAKTGNLDKAKEPLLLTEEFLDNDRASYYVHYINYYLGEYYYITENYAKAILHLEESKKAYDKTTPSDIIGLVLNRLGHATMRNGDPKKSCDYFDQAFRMNDSIDIIRRNNILNITDWKVKYDLDRKEKQINDLENVNEKANASIKYKNYIILLSLLSIFIICIIYAFRKKRNLHEKTALWERNRLLTEEQDKLRKQNTALLESIESIQKEIKKKEKKYENSTLSEAEMQKIEELILKVLVDKKYYLNPKLTLEVFAKKVDVNRSYLSQIVNQRFEMNFRQLINYYRVVEAHNLLCAKENENYSIDYIAKKAGFKSLSPFIQAFKNQTGLTPAVYRKKYTK